MIYDVQIGNQMHSGLSYAELTACPLQPDTYVRRNNSEWMRAKECVELSHILAVQDNARDARIDNTGIAGFTDAYCDSDSMISDICPDLSEDEDGVGYGMLVPSAEYFRCRQKRKAALIGVCTFGLAGLSLMGVGNTWRSNIFAGTSFSANAGMGFVFKCLSFCLLTAMTAIPYFIYSVFALIYYSLRMNSLRK